MEARARVASMRRAASERVPCAATRNNRQLHARRAPFIITRLFLKYFFTPDFSKPTCVLTLDRREPRWEVRAKLEEATEERVRALEAAEREDGPAGATRLCAAADISVVAIGDGRLGERQCVPCRSEAAC